MAASSVFSSIYLLEQIIKHNTLLNVILSGFSGDLSKVLVAHTFWHENSTRDFFIHIVSAWVSVAICL